MFQFLPPKESSSQKKEEDPKSQKVDSNKAYERYMNHYRASQLPYGGMLSHESAAQLKAEGRGITPSKHIQTGTESSGVNDAVQLKQNPIQRFVKEEGKEKLRQRKVAQKSEEEEEEPLQTKTAQMAGMEDENEMMQGKFIQKQESLEDEELMQSKHTQKKADQENNSSPVSGGTTTKMPEDVQAKMEGSFNTDFSSVNIHTNDPSAKEMGALAYTQGSDISFANGQYNPSSQSGQELLGHELTHVVQQREGRVQPTKQGKAMPINDSPALEKEADKMGMQAAQGRNLGMVSTGTKLPTNTSGLNVKSNTISLKSLEGNDYGVDVNHNGGTIVIAANIYAPDAQTAAENTLAADQWNSYSGATYTTKNGTVYAIEFRIQVINLNSQLHEGRAVDDPIGNSVKDITSDADFEQEYTRLGGKEKPADVGGYTSGNKHIRNRQSQATSNTRAHEIGHLFFLNEGEGGGAMTYQDSLNKVKPVSEKNAKRVIKRALKQIKRQKKGKDVQEGVFINGQGVAGDDFLQGKINF